MEVKTLGILLFDEFELLDVTGPVEMFGALPDKIKLVFIAEEKKLIRSTQSLSVMPDTDINHVANLNYLLVPGGKGTRTLIYHQVLLNWIKEQANKVELLLSVCTGAALLAKAGVLDHRKATSNKLAFEWVKEQGPKTNWIRQARWVDDGNIITSSGVAAGIDMSLYVIARLFGQEMRDHAARKTEYQHSENPENDPFA